MDNGPTFEDVVAAVKEFRKTNRVFYPRWMDRIVKRFCKALMNDKYWCN